MRLQRPEILTFRLALVVAVIAITYLATTEQSYPVVEDLNDKLTHVMAFFGLALLADFAFPQDRLGTRRVLALLGYGIAIELIQHLLPHRDASLLDVLADGVGIAAYSLAAPLIRRLPLLRRRWHEVESGVATRPGSGSTDRR